MPTLFRPARSRSAPAHVAWTLAQSAVIWALALVVVPALIVMLERRIGAPAFHFAGQSLLAIVLFTAFSTLNLAAGGILAVRGRGTPLPLACPNDLVVSGPYRHVRNPMAIAGIGQGISVGIWLGSWLVLLYAFAGAILWHVGIRPSEERDLAARFGSSYDRYRSDVRLWWPK